MFYFNDDNALLHINKIKAKINLFIEKKEKEEEEERKR